MAAKMREVKAIIGGEGNGGVIDPRVGFVRDPFVGMAMILNLMAETNRKLSELVRELPAYTIIKDKYTVARDRLPGCFERLRTSGRRPRPTATTACGSTGRTVGFTFGPATPNRLSASSPRPPPPSLPPSYAGTWAVCSGRERRRTPPPNPLPHGEGGARGQGCSAFSPTCLAPPLRFGEGVGGWGRFASFVFPRSLDTSLCPLGLRGIKKLAEPVPTRSRPDNMAQRR